MNADLTTNANKVTVNLDRMINALPQDVDKTLFATAQYGINLILDRTEKGRGITGPFKRYTPQYAKIKRSGWSRTPTRRGFSGDPSGTVNLMVTGEMLGSMSAKKGRGVSSILFARQSEARKAAFNQKKRPFFGFNTAEKQRLGDFFRARLIK